MVGDPQLLCSKLRLRITFWPAEDWEILVVSRAVNIYLFESGKDKTGKGYGWAPSIISYPRNVSNCRCHMTPCLRKTLTLLVLMI